MSIVLKMKDAYRREGLISLPLRTVVYLLRRIAWSTEAWSKRLDQSINSAAILRDYRSVLARNERFRDCHKGQRCFIIGNGPSLNQQDLSLLAGEITFAVNSSYKHPVVEQWQPTYHFMADPLLFTGTEAAKEYYAELTSRIHSSTYFVMHYAEDLIRRLELLPPEQTYYLALSGEIEVMLSRGLSLTRPLPDTRTIVELALMTAIYMGCSPIYLLGCDHDWLAHRGAHYNFYGEEQGDNPDLLTGLQEPYDVAMGNLLTVWKNYRALEAYSKRVGVKIFNATHGGFLDVFERVSYSSLFDSQSNYTLAVREHQCLSG